MSIQHGTINFETTKTQPPEMDQHHIRVHTAPHRQSSDSSRSQVGSQGFSGTEVVNAMITRMEKMPMEPLLQDAESDSDSKSSTSHRKDWWSAEIAAIVFSALCLAGIIVVLEEVNDTPLSQWHLPIAPNSVIAIFSTLPKSALLLPITASISQLKWLYFRTRPSPLSKLQKFDDASRGPLGALKFICSMNQGAVAANSGAIITILTLALDPFTQQIIGYPLRHVAIENGRASIKIAQTYDTGLS